MVSRTMMRKVWRDLATRKASLAALIFIMGFGIAALVGFLSVARDLQRAKDNYFFNQRMGDFFIDLKRAPMWVADQVAEFPNIKSVRGRVYLSVIIDLPDLPEPVAGIALSLPEQQAPIINDVILKRGTWFSGPRAQEVLLNDSFAKANNLVPGNRITVQLLDEQRDMLIVGMVTSPEFIYLIPPSGGLAPDPKRFAAMYFEESFLREAGDLDGAWNQIIGTMHDNSDAAMNETLDRLKEVLDEFGAINALPMTEQVSTKFLLNELENVYKSSVITPVIFLLVATLILNVLVARLVQQQRVVIGTLKAIGFSSGQVFRHYTLYGVLIGIAGGVVGILLAGVIYHAMISLYRAIFEFPSIDKRFHPDLMVLGIFISVIAASIGTIKGTRQAVNLQPAEAMHPPPPEKAHRTPLELFPAVWSRLSFRWKMVFRAIFRNPFRSAVSVFAGIIASMLILGAYCMRDGMKKLMRYELEEVSHQDITIKLREPRGAGFDSEMLQWVDITEPQLLVPVDLINGAYTKNVAITGIDSGNVLYTPLDKNDQPVPIPPAGLILSKKLAEIMNLRAGDDVLLQPLFGERRPVTARVVALVDTYVGLSAYASIDYLSRLIGEEWSANAVLTQSPKGTDLRPVLAQMKDIRSVTGASRRAQMVEQFEETFSKANAVIISIFIVFAMVIGFGSVLNSSLVSLSERIREVATLRVLGFTNGQVAGIFALESFLLYGIGALLGLVAGYFYVHFLSFAYSSELFRFPTVIREVRMVLTIVLITLCISAAQVLVLFMVSKLDWLEALKVKE